MYVLDTYSLEGYNYKAANAAGREKHGVRYHLLDYKGRQVMYMSAFEIISTILMIIALLFAAYKMGKGNRK